MIKLGESKPVTLPTNAGIIINLSKKGTTDEGKSGVVPHHLINLYNEAAAGRTTGEQEDILHLLQKYSHAFSVNEYDLGQWNGPRRTRFSYYALFLRLHYEFLLLFSKCYGYSSWRLLYGPYITSIYGVLYQMGQA
jgi:hypothetical protein